MKTPQVSFKDFCNVAKDKVHFDPEQNSDEEINDLLNDWYILYRETNFVDVPSFLTFHLTEVSRDTHNFWLK